MSRQQSTTLLVSGASLMTTAATDSLAAVLHTPTTLASAAAGVGQQRSAAALCGVAMLATVAILPFASAQAPALPGFLLIHQTALIVALTASAGVLFAQFRRGRSLPLLLVAAGTLYTAFIVTLQLLSYANVFGAGPVIGSGSATTIWLWTFWHLGPPLCGIAYALALPRHRRPLRLIARERAGSAAVLAAGVATLAAAASGFVATALLPWLPQQVTPGGDYGQMVTSGIGPAVQALTLAALAAMWRTTRGDGVERRRSVVELWIVVALALLVLDNFVTLAGGARGTWGWYSGRVLALLSGFSILWAYLTEVDTLHGRAEAAAEERTRAEAALRQAQKMEAVGRLTGGVAHDFNNLLMVVTSGFELIQRHPTDPARVERLAAAGLHAAARGAHLTQQLLSFARLKNLRPEVVNPNTLVLRFEALLRRAVSENVALRLALDPGLHPVRIDAAEFEAAMLNLVVNARDALPLSGGSIEITSHNADLDEAGAAAMRSADAAPGAYIVVTVADTGVGMDAATLAHVFEPFFTTKEVGKGSGLGLSQVYGFARSAEGFVEIRTAPGRGTRVELWLPHLAAAGMRPGSRAADAGGPPPLRPAHEGAGRTVLAVEDEPAVLAAVVEQLADLGYAVLPARDAHDALQRLRGPEHIDLLFSDVVMPGTMSGIQLAAEAARLRPGLRVVLTSGYTGQALLGRDGKAVDLPILPKPYDHHALAQHMRQALEPAAC